MCKCAFCGQVMPEERLELGLTECIKCAPQDRPLGVMEYGHKTAGVLVVTYSRQEFEDLKKPANKRR
jgi:hypothetical protein